MCDNPHPNPPPEYRRREKAGASPKSSRARRRVGILAAFFLFVCIAIIASSLWSMWRLPVQQDWALFTSPRGYLSAIRSSDSTSQMLILDGDGIEYDVHGRLETMPYDPGWHFDSSNRNLYPMNESGAVFRPDRTRRWIDIAGLYLFTGSLIDPVQPTSSARYLIVRLPHWLIVLLAAIFPLWMATRFLIHRRRYGHFPAGHCPKCGYDLRATPERCPECGTETNQTRRHADPGA